MLHMSPTLEARRFRTSAILGWAAEDVLRERRRPCAVVVVFLAMRGGHGDAFIRCRLGVQGGRSRTERHSTGMDPDASASLEADSRTFTFTKSTARGC